MGVKESFREKNERKTRQVEETRNKKTKREKQRAPNSCGKIIERKPWFVSQYIHPELVFLPYAFLLYHFLGDLESFSTLSSTFALSFLHIPQNIPTSFFLLYISSSFFFSASLTLFGIYLPFGLSPASSRTNFCSLSFYLSISISLSYSHPDFHMSRYFAILPFI